MLCDLQQKPCGLPVSADPHRLLSGLAQPLNASVPAAISLPALLPMDCPETSEQPACMATGCTATTVNGPVFHQRLGGEHTAEFDGTSDARSHSTSTGFHQSAYASTSGLLIGSAAGRPIDTATITYANGTTQPITLDAFLDVRVAGNLEARVRSQFGQPSLVRTGAGITTQLNTYWSNEQGDQRGETIRGLWHAGAGEGLSAENIVPINELITVPWRLTVPANNQAHFTAQLDSFATAESCDPGMAARAGIDDTLTLEMVSLHLSVVGNGSLPCV